MNSLSRAAASFPAQPGREVASNTAIITISILFIFVLLRIGLRPHSPAQEDRYLTLWLRLHFLLEFLSAEGTAQFLFGVGQNGLVKDLIDVIFLLAEGTGHIVHFSHDSSPW
jgi:hypothetical protein